MSILFISSMITDGRRRGYRTPSGIYLCQPPMYIGARLEARIVRLTLVHRSFRYANPRSLLFYINGFKSIVQLLDGASFCYPLYKVVIKLLVEI